MINYAKMTRAFLSLLLFISCTTTAEDLVESYPEAAMRAKVAIIIDDLGYTMAEGRKLAAIPFDITFSVIPFTPYGKKIAHLAHRNQKEIMLHAPMETLAQVKWERGLDTSMKESEFITTMEKMVDDIPFVKGLNNHGGSKLTQNRPRMDWVMAFLSRRALYFIDSRTIANSQAGKAAQHAQIANRSRDIFLDNEKDPEQIQVQLEKLRKIALKRGDAIAIGHPYPETLEALRKVLPEFAKQGIELVSVSKLLKESHKT
ncbi:divergent polysaccharide deacetylase family protein [Agarilytica rhodophyticola]|uniref:divergent polysaccharide deacetylase family protein n=1 Tax=Agarilytica rhodophyticola TaxID=1737490 RepID=UPI000B347D62|nr:divergent polysaccharide deacetylase family protein [Agarilytica rhodophyticola]